MPNNTYNDLVKRYRNSAPKQARLVANNENIVPNTTVATTPQVTEPKNSDYYQQFLQQYYQAQSNDTKGNYQESANSYDNILQSAKDLYNSKYADLSDTQRSSWNTLISQLTQAYNNAQAAYSTENASKSTATANALNYSAAKDMSSKYMNNVLANNGLGSSGLSETSRVSMGNTYANQLADNKRSLDSNLASNYYNFTGNSNENYTQMNEAYSNAINAEKQAAYNKYASQLMNADIENFYSVLDQAKNELGEESDLYVQLASESQSLRELAVDKTLAAYGTNSEDFKVDLENLIITDTKAFNKDHLDKIVQAYNLGLIKNGQTISANGNTFVLMDGKLYLAPNASAKFDYKDLDDQLFGLSISKGN